MKGGYAAFTDYEVEVCANAAYMHMLAPQNSNPTRKPTFAVVGGFSKGGYPALFHKALGHTVHIFVEQLVFLT